MNKIPFSCHEKQTTRTSKSSNRLYSWRHKTLLRAPSAKKKRDDVGSRRWAGHSEAGAFRHQQNLA